MKVRWCLSSKHSLSEPNSPALNGLDLTIPAGKLWRGWSFWFRENHGSTLVEVCQPYAGRLLVDGTDLRYVSGSS